MFTPMSHTKFPLPISRATFECLTSSEPRIMTDARIPSEHNIVLEKSTDGGYYSFHDAGRFSIFVVPPTETNPNGLILENFYQYYWSNFLLNTGIWWTINGQSIRFKCAEQVFKSTCVISHMDPEDDTSADARMFAMVLESTMSAKSPLDCKRAPNAIPKNLFQAQKWDDMSYFPMVEAQKLKCTGDVYHRHMQFLGSLAKEHGIKADRIYFTECAGDRDLRWGNGLKLDEMTELVHKNIKDPVWLHMGVSGHSLPFPGANLLGRALVDTCKIVLGENLEFVGEDVDGYIARVGTACPLFVYTPSDDAEGLSSSDASPLKRARTMSAPAFGRTGSSAAVDDAATEDEEDVAGNRSPEPYSTLTGCSLEY